LMRSDSASRSRASVVENTFTPVNFWIGTAARVPGRHPRGKDPDGYSASIASAMPCPPPMQAPAMP
jgi:hypothetical protein